MADNETQETVESQDNISDVMEPQKYEFSPDEPMRGSVFEDENADSDDTDNNTPKRSGRIRGSAEFPDSELVDLTKHYERILKGIQNGETILEMHNELGVTRRKLKWFIDHDEKLKEAWDKVNENELEDYYDTILNKIIKGETIRVIHSEIGVTRRKLKWFIDQNPELKEAWDDAQEDILDLNEEIINEIATADCSMVETEAGMFPRMDGRIMASKLNAAKLRLERLGGKRGWNAKLETNEVGNGGRVPVIFCGDVSEESIAEGEALVEAANQEAMKGLDGIPRG